MRLGDTSPGDVVACEIHGEPHVLRVGALFGVEWSGKGKHRKGVATGVLVDRLDPDTLRSIPFKPGYAFPTSIVDVDIDVEVIATVSFMRALRRERHMTAGRATAFESAAARDVDTDPMQRGKT